MMTRLVVILLAPAGLMTGHQPGLASPPFQERLPGSEGYCPRIASPGDTVTLRVCVANDSPETARGTVVQISLPSGLVLDERSVYVVPGARAGRFSPVVAASASAGIAWASTSASDEWRAYTLVVAARLGQVASGEQLAIALAEDATGNLIRRVDGVVYIKPRDTSSLSVPVVIDMGVRYACQTEPTPTASPTPTATPTSTPVPPPFYTSRLALSEAEGVPYSVAVVCVFDPGQTTKRPSASRYVIALDTPANARVALALGPDPNVSGDGRGARFELRPDGSAMRVAIAIRPAPGEPRFETPLTPGLRVSADGIGDLREGQAGASDGCPVDPAVAQAMSSAERAAQARQVPLASVSAAAPQPSATILAKASPTPARPDTQAVPGAAPIAGPIAPSGASPVAMVDRVTARVQPDPRSVMLPVMCAAGIVLAASAFGFAARRREAEL